MATEITVTEPQSFEVSNFYSTTKMAAELKQHVKDNRLTTNIQGRDYVQVEGWQFAGAMLGIFAMADDAVRIESEGEIKYSCSAKLMNIKTNQIVGSGFAVCSNKEGKKKSFDEYAIASMAQTRAIGKAYRNMLAWVMRAAGYEPTPAEEMDFAEGKRICLEVEQIQKMIKGAKSEADMDMISETYPEIKEASIVLRAYSDKKKSFTQQPATT